MYYQKRKQKQRMKESDEHTPYALYPELNFLTEPRLVAKENKNASNKHPSFIEKYSELNFIKEQHLANQVPIITKYTKIRQLELELIDYNKPFPRKHT
ncbi:hypothetical protein HZH66_010494 [Vespula vulgaris]|uniref:Uncharacterized protein n=1 Tax=Vespula vulgaris TaxID=7454 RepID=A0A834MY28_VESVU|nr:hypothetical protein HZH66_010494 [Vespula vulgaris]